MRLHALAAFAVLVSGCATAPTDISLNQSLDSKAGEAGIGEASGDEAIVVFAIGPIGTAGGYQFQRLNADQTDFEGDPVALGFAAWGVGDKMKRPEGEESSVWVLKNEINFLIKKIKAGTYALTYFTWNTYNGVSTGTAWNCLDDGAVAFEVVPGEINLLSSRDAVPPGVVTRLSGEFTEQDILEQFERTRQNYPNLNGEPVRVYPTLEARWTEAKGGFFSNPCEKAEPGSLSVSRILRAGDEAAEPDAADMAAIAAALENAKKNTEETETNEETE